MHLFLFLTTLPINHLLKFNHQFSNININLQFLHNISFYDLNILLANVVGMGVVVCVVVVGQACLLQGCVSLARPTQFFPPLAGGGFEQVLSLERVPPSQDLLHGLKDP